MTPIKLKIVNIDRKNKTCMVETASRKRFPVKIEMPECHLEDIKLGDDAVITKSAVTGEWLMIDYKFNNPFNYSVHNSYQGEDLICDEGGNLYDFQ